MKSAIPTILSGSAFIESVRRSDLVGESSLNNAIRGIDCARCRADELAARFVSSGLLTDYQSRRLLVGKTSGFLLGPYLLLEPIGDSSARVFRARHRAMNRTVAIKMLCPERSRSDELRDAFESATRSAVRLLHPNIVTTYDANNCGNRMYAVLEFVSGPTLGQYVRDRAPLSPAIACAIARQIALALTHAHERGIVHGLLHPDNVLVSSAADGSPIAKVLNFGYGQLAARFADTATRQLDGAIAIADYLAPETFDPARLPDAAADLFSLGCLLHFLLAGRPPAGDGPVHQFSNRYGVKRWRPGLSNELLELIDGLLQTDPAQRRSSAAAVAARLNIVARGRGVDELPLSNDLHAGSLGNSPFAELDTLSDFDAEGTAEMNAYPPVGGSRLLVGICLLAATVILATGSAIALVLRSAMR
jgi:serine/threonine protein kinase